MPSDAVIQQIEAIERGWRRLRDAVELLGPDGLDRRTSSGWTVKELVAHVAFWEEAVDPVVNAMFRGAEVRSEEWYGGDDLGVGPDDPWPEASVHNAREAAWARARTPEEVLARWDRSHRRLLDVVATLTDDEVANDEYLARLGATTSLHYTEHLPEVEALHGVTE